MEKLDISKFKILIEDLINNFVIKDYNKIERLKQNGSIPIIDLINRINEYGEDFISLPSYWIKDTLIYNINNKRLDVYLPLWTKAGKSDLTLSLSCFFINDCPYIEINDLEVL